MFLFVESFCFTNFGDNKPLIKATVRSGSVTSSKVFSSKYPSVILLNFSLNLCYPCSGLQVVFTVVSQLSKLSKLSLSCLSAGSYLSLSCLSADSHLSLSCLSAVSHESLKSLSEVSLKSFSAFTQTDLSQLSPSALSLSSQLSHLIYYSQSILCQTVRA